MDEGEVALGRDLARVHRRVLDGSPSSTHLGAEPRGPSTFTNGVRRGITMVAGIPSRRA